MPIKLKLVKETGQRVYVRVYWNEGGLDPAQHKGWSYHDAMQHIGDLPVDANISGHEVTDAEYEQYFARWPHVCEICGKPAPPRGHEDVHYTIFYEHLYDSPPRLLQPGDVFYTPWMHDSPDCFSVVLPLKMSYDFRYYTWNNYQISSSCNHGNRQLHKCWNSSGTPPDVTVSPSILYYIPGYRWHGHIRNGEIIDA